MPIKLFARRTVWLPTLWGGLLLAFLLLLPAGLWLGYGERYLSMTQPAPPGVLVVEAWTGPGAMVEAARLYRDGGFRWVVATAVTEPDERGFGSLDFAAHATRLLVEQGVPRDRILRLSLPTVPRDRTLTAMSAVVPALQANGIQDRCLTVFTVGPHARRSRLVLASVSPGYTVGAIAWFRADRDKAHWWESTERTKDFFVESVLYAGECVRSCWR